MNHEDHEEGHEDHEGLSHDDHDEAFASASMSRYRGFGLVALAIAILNVFGFLRSGLMPLYVAATIVLVFPFDLAKVSPIEMRRAMASLSE